MTSKYNNKNHTQKIKTKKKKQKTTTKFEERLILKNNNINQIFEINATKI